MSIFRKATGHRKLKNGSYRFNFLAIEKLKIDTAYLDTIKKKLEKSPEEYCRFIAKAFSIPFKKTMTELLVDGKALIEAKVRGLCCCFTCDKG